jgi:hypothetical protein
MVNRDLVLQGFLETQYADGMALAAASDLLALHPLGNAPYQQYRAEFRCGGLIQIGGEIARADCFNVGITFSDDYLRTADPFGVACWLTPPNAWYPNVKPPFMCLGPIAPGTSLVELLYRAHRLITYNSVTMSEQDALNHEACHWARANTDKFPVDSRPLKRRAVTFQIETAGVK